MTECERAERLKDEILDVAPEALLEACDGNEWCAALLAAESYFKMTAQQESINIVTVSDPTIADLFQFGFSFNFLLKYYAEDYSDIDIVRKLNQLSIPATLSYTNYGYMDLYDIVHDKHSSLPMEFQRKVREKWEGLYKPYVSPPLNIDIGCSPRERKVYVEMMKELHNAYYVAKECGVDLKRVFKCTVGHDMTLSVNMDKVGKYIEEGYSEPDIAMKMQIPLEELSFVLHPNENNALFRKSCAIIRQWINCHTISDISDEFHMNTLLIRHIINSRLYHISCGVTSIEQLILPNGDKPVMKRNVDPL